MYPCPFVWKQDGGVSMQQSTQVIHTGIGGAEGKGGMLSDGAQQQQVGQLLWDYTPGVNRCTGGGGKGLSLWNISGRSTPGVWVSKKKMRKYPRALTP